MPGPMSGVNVVELGVWIAGPAAGGFMADWGADVIKLESPSGGDPARTFQKMFGTDLDTNAIFEMDNRAKRSVAVDLRHDEGNQLALELLADADVFITNLRLAALQGLGLDWDSLRERFPRLIYCHITGYGLSGPDVNRAAFDIAAFWARSGIASQLSEEGQPPPFQRGGMGDHNAGMAGAAAISAALYEREKSGQGQMVSTSLFREGMYTISFDLNALLMWGTPIGLGKRTKTANPAMNNYQAGDGRRFWITGLEALRHWEPLVRVVGQLEWLEDERFSGPRARYENSEELIGMLDEIFATKSLDEWSTIFATEPEFFWAPINTLDDLLADEQAWASGAFIDVPDSVGTTTMVATPIDFERSSWAPRGLAPDLGEHTDAVLSALGKSPDEIARMRADGVVA